MTELWNLRIGLAFQSVNDLKKMLLLLTPVSLQNGLVTAGVLNNLDHNHCSITAVDAFHDTDISLFQFLDSTS